MVEDHTESALDISGAAKLLNVTTSALRRWKELRQGPAYFKAGRLVRYRREDLLRWIAENTIEPRRKQDFLARSRKRKPR